MSFNFIDIFAAIISAVISSMGFGGGGVLILYLTLFKDMPQLQAQGLNLLFFVPCSVTSLIVYAKRKQIKYKTILPIIIGGVAGVMLGMYFINRLNPKYFKIAFAVFMVLSGIMTVFGKKEKKDKSK